MMILYGSDVLKLKGFKRSVKKVSGRPVLKFKKDKMDQT